MTSIKQRRHQSRVEARRREGLTDDTLDTKLDVSQPSLAYVQNPKIFNKGMLQENRRMQMLHELKKTEANFATHKDAQARIEDRENCQLRMVSNGPQSKLTRVQLDQRRRAEMVLDNTSKFGNVTVGIHG